MRRLKVSLGTLVIFGLVFITASCGSATVPQATDRSGPGAAAGIAGSGRAGIPDTTYTRLVADTVQRGDLYLPRVPGAFVHIRVRKLLFPRPVEADFWLGPEELGSQHRASGP